MSQKFQAKIVYRHSKGYLLKKRSSKIIFQIVATSLTCELNCNPVFPNLFISSQFYSSAYNFFYLLIKCLVKDNPRILNKNTILTIVKR